MRNGPHHEQSNHTNGVLADRRFTPCLMLCHFPPQKNVVLRLRLREANFQYVASLVARGTWNFLLWAGSATNRFETDDRLDRIDGNAGFADANAIVDHHIIGADFGDFRAEGAKR